MKINFKRRAGSNTSGSMGNLSSEITTIIFDLDGVVVDSLPDIIDAVQKTLLFVNSEQKDYDFIKNTLGGGARNGLLRCLSDDKQHLIDEALKYFGEYYPENCANKTILYPGVADVLAYYYGKKKLALATAKLRAATLNILKKLDVIDYFDVIITADDVEKPKPDPQCIEKILEGIDCKREKTIIIGDTATDIIAGKNAGIMTCAVLYGYGAVEQIESCGPDFIINEITELKKIII